jgi:predicted nucleic acid-binding protein
VILVDTGAIYALVDSNDVNHQKARDYYQSIAGREEMVILSPILTESWFLVESRLGPHVANRLIQSILSGIFSFREIGLGELSRALEIERKYKTANFGLIDAICFAFAENNGIKRDFTFDKHFSIYRPEHVKQFIIHP